MDPITALTSSSVLGQLSAPEAPQSVSTANQQRFEDALGIEQIDAVEANSESAVAETEPQVTSQSLGGALLEGIEDIKTTLDARSERITRQLTELAGSPMSLRDAMQMQYELMQMNMQQELTSKMADKTSQGVQMLFRNQG